MNQLIVLAFDHFADARAALGGLRSLEREGRISFEDTAIVERDPDGTALIGGIVTFAFPIAGAAIGAAVGAAIGAALGRGVSASFVDEMTTTLRPGRSALFLVVRQSDADAVMAALRSYRGEVVQTTLDSETEEALRDALTKPR